VYADIRVGSLRIGRQTTTVVNTGQRFSSLCLLTYYDVGKCCTYRYNEISHLSC